MDQDHENHLQSIKDKFAEEVDSKYRRGQQEHGGNLWMKKHILDMAIEEAVDLIVYLYTLQDQLEIFGLEVEDAE